jgi:anaerobic ribonucleoside-triphosphate reductase activating protein
MDGAAGKTAKEALALLDVLVDGPFVEKRKTGNAIWRGSDNQRLIDVQRSLAEGSVIELPESKVKK